MTPTEAYIAGLATLPVIVLLISLARPKAGRAQSPATATTKPETFTMPIEITGIDEIEASLARVNEAARQTADRLREVAELGERIARKPDTNA